MKTKRDTMHSLQYPKEYYSCLQYLSLKESKKQKSGDQTYTVTICK